MYQSTPTETSEDAPERSVLKRRPCGALVIGGAHGSLAVARSLGRHGVPVYFLTDDHPLARHSRYVGRSSFWPGPSDPSAAAFLIELAHRCELLDWVLYPGSDADAKLISQNHAFLSKVFRVTTPPWNVVQWASDKRLTYRRAAMLDIAYPWTCYPKSLAEVADLRARFPLVLKPAVRHAVNAFTQAKAWRVDTQAELAARYAEAASLVGPEGVVLQEMIPGTGATQFSYAAVWDNDHALASLTARRTRQYPIEFGYTSTFVESVDAPDVAEAARKFLTSLEYRGLVEVEFKYDARDRRYKLLDVNTRTWTWNGLGRLAGVDFPYVLWRWVRGDTCGEMQGWPGFAWTHTSRDFVAAIQEIHRGTLSVREYWNSLRMPKEFAAFAPDDPLPAVADLYYTIQRAFKRR